MEEVGPEAVSQPPNSTASQASKRPTSGITSDVISNDLRLKNQDNQDLNQQADLIDRSPVPMDRYRDQNVKRYSLKDILSKEKSNEVEMLKMED